MIDWKVLKGVKDFFLWKNGFLGNYKNFLDEPGECAWWSDLPHSREKYFRLKNCFLLKHNKFLGRIFFFGGGRGGGGSLDLVSLPDESISHYWWPWRRNEKWVGGKKLCLILSDFYFNSFMTEVPII